MSNGALVAITVYVAVMLILLVRSSFELSIAYPSVGVRSWLKMIVLVLLWPLSILWFIGRDLISWFAVALTRNKHDEYL